MSLFVGNVHRFCSHYLFDNNAVARDTTVIDEQEALSIMASIFGWDEGSLANNGNKRILTNAIKLQHLGYMIANGCPKEFLMHTDLFRMFDYKTLFKLVSLDYTMENFAGLYTGTVFRKLIPVGHHSTWMIVSNSSGWQENTNSIRKKGIWLTSMTCLFWPIFTLHGIRTG